MPALVPTAPVLAEPIQVAATSLSGLATSSNCTLQVIPTQSTSCHDIFALGEVYRFSAKDVRKRSKYLIAYVSPSTGVVVLDANTQTTVSSASFSSSLRPISPPLVLQDNKFLASFVVLKSRSSDNWAELHAWIEEDQGPSTAPILKTYNCQIDDDIISLHPLSTSELLARHQDGHFSIIEFQSFSEPKFTNKSTHYEKVLANRPTLFVDVFERTEITYLAGSSTGKTPAQALIVLLTAAREASSKPKRKPRKSAIEVIDAAEAGNLNEEVENVVRVEYFAVGVEGSTIDSRIRKLGQADIPLDKDEVISNASVRSSGALSMITENGRLISATLQSSQDGSPRIENINSFTVSGITSSSNAAILRTSLSTALITFSTSLATGRSMLNTLLVDTELDCVLAEQSWKAPEDHAQIFMQPLNMTKIASAITFTIPKSLKQTKPLVHIWSTSYQTGEGGHLRWALASRHLTRKWITLKSEGQGRQGKGETKEVEGTKSHEELIKELNVISNSEDKSTSNAKSMEKIFKDWLKSHRNDPLSQSFVSELLNIALPLSDVANESETVTSKPYPKAVVHHLLDQKVVHGVSLEPRTLVTALSSVGDWDAVYKTLETVKDISEDDVVRTIRRATYEENTSTKRLPTILTFVSKNQFSSAELRKSMKDRLDEKCVEAILNILNDWLAFAEGDALLKDQSSQEEVQKPSLLQVLAFSTEVLDTFFPLMLVTPSLQSAVQQLSTHVETHLSKTNVLNLLRGPLAAFAKLNDDRLREAENQTAELTAELAALQGLEELDDLEELKRSERFTNGLYRTKGPDSSRGKQGKTSSQANIAQQIGAGSLSRSGQRQLTRRQQTYANNLAVGQYALEEFNP